MGSSVKKRHQFFHLVTLMGGLGPSGMQSTALVHEQIQATAQ